ncbi:MAG: RNA methyltransferase [Nitrospinota bacterium]|nr:RNA methyltransferase [Nitrospinota bacterium]
MTKKADQKGRQAKKPPLQKHKKEEFLIYGWNACLQAFKKRPQDLYRVFFSKDRARQLGEVKKWCSSRKLPYRELDDVSLRKAAGSVHHGGLVMVTRPTRPVSIHRLVKQGLARNTLLVALDRVGNAHNVGAILRSAAYFSASGLVMTLEEGQAMITPSVARTAEGALETVPLYDCKDLPSALRDLKGKTEGSFILGAEPGSRRSLYDLEVSFPCVVVLGNERDGLSSRVKRRCDSLVNIPGSKTMQSLNVSVAAGIILAELARRMAENGR